VLVENIGREVRCCVMRGFQKTGKA